MKTKFIIPFLLLLLTSCFKKDDPVVLPVGGSEINSCYMGPNYENQMYFDLGTNTFQQRQLSDWDLCFESTDDGKGIFINSGKNIIVRKIGLYNLNETFASDTAFFKKYPELVDASNGKIATSAIGDWAGYQLPDGRGGTIYGIYIIELRYLSGADRYRRLQITGTNDSEFSCLINNLNSINGNVTIIPKNKTQNFTYFSFKNGGEIVHNAEPNKESWDIEFTQYKTIITKNTPVPLLYQVKGVFSNPNKVTVGIDSTNKFEDITANSISSLWFSNDRDAIGYEWKSYDINKGLYTVNSKINYIIKDTEGHIYKLRFLDFYDKMKVSGNPKFEFARIQ